MSVNLGPNNVMYEMLYNLHCTDVHSSGWINFFSQNNGTSYLFGQHRILKLIATLYINVHVTNFNNSGTEELHVILLKVIMSCDKSFKYSPINEN